MSIDLASPPAVAVLVNDCQAPSWLQSSPYKGLCKLALPIIIQPLPTRQQHALIEIILRSRSIKFYIMYQHIGLPKFVHG